LYSGLHIPTLVVATLSVSFATSMLLLLLWIQNPRAKSLYYWGAANLVATAAGIFIFRHLHLPEIVPVVFANSFMILAYGLFWSGTRVFEGRPASVTRVVAGPVIWLAACAIPAFYGSEAARTGLASALFVAYTLATIFELWRGRAESKLASRLPAMMLLGVHAAIHVLWSHHVFLTASTQDVVATGHSLMTSAVFAALIHVIAIIFLMIGLTKEKLELEQRRAAEADQLTSALNRRAFFDRASAVLSDLRGKNAYAAIIALDIDHFKSINDRFGHGGGDFVLEKFSSHARIALGSEVLFARLGGEEFSVLITGRDHASVFEITENLRAAIAETKIRLPSGAQLDITLSAGIAFAGEAAGYELESLLKLADTALYCAKHNGRDRIEVYMPDADAAVAMAA